MQIPFTEIELGFYNLLSCKGFEAADSMGISFGPCAQAKLGLVLLFFITAFVRKWGGEEMGVDFSFAGGLIGGLLSYFIIITLIGTFKVVLICFILIDVLRKVNEFPDYKDYILMIILSIVCISSALKMVGLFRIEDKIDSQIKDSQNYRKDYH